MRAIARNDHEEKGFHDHGPAGENGEASTATRRPTATRDPKETSRRGVNGTGGRESTDL